MSSHESTFIRPFVCTCACGCGDVLRFTPEQVEQIPGPLRFYRAHHGPLGMDALRTCPLAEHSTSISSLTASELEALNRVSADIRQF